MASSILNTVKRVLGLPEDYHAFDQDVIMHINTALSNLTQLGIGPDEGLLITDDVSTWEQFLGGDPKYAMAQSFTYLKVRMLFDPPTLGYVITAWKEQLDELTWRLNIAREENEYPGPVPDLGNDLILDGGSP